jgi:hypothetical protein
MTGYAKAGSQRWLQVCANRRPELLQSALRRAGAIECREAIEWVSPLAEHRFCEYRDGEALRRARVSPGRMPLRDFWPARGPVWDAIGRTSTGAALWVEAKANIPEAASPATAAGPASRARIESALKDARRYSAPRARADWTGLFYQYANRLAHHYFLTRLNGLPSRLIFLYFVNADDVDGPLSEAEWTGVSRLIHAALGLPKDLRRFGVFDAFVDARHLNDAE